MKSTYKKAIKNKTILITGGTGSFGNQVVSLLLTCQPKKIIIFSRDETKQYLMRNKFNNPLLKFVIGDVRDYERVNEVMNGVDYVFHASALKHVPACEFFPIEAVKTNVLGAHNVVNAALANNVKKIVALSTDKAVYPINAMGMTKALMEKIILAKAKEQKEKSEEKMKLCVVRYGNVLYTRGSVIPFFIDLMKQKKQLIVTHPDMTRFLLPLSQAVDLVLYALTTGESGNTYIYRSPACTMETLAKAICKIFDYKKGYQIVGARAGEKMHETLITHEEILRTENLGKYGRIKPESQGLDYSQYFFDNKVSGKKTPFEKFQAYTSENTKRLNVEQTIKILLTLPQIKEELSVLKR
jgi:UDP-N-acetylglucosamine 4,6-dehydratase/5-epimerase